MSKEYQICWPAHPNFYNNWSSREFNVYFSEPEDGVNSDTGILLFIAGFGGNANSNVYKKMRSKFADQYNLITIQCDYFGQEFMQGSNSVNLNLPKEAIQGVFSDEEIEKIYENGFNFNKFIEKGKKYKISVPVKEVLKETKVNFNDMGILQTIDNITAVTYVLQILKDNNLNINTGKVMIFGQSHGSYLGYLCNLFAPNLFTFLLDNSAWLLPVYLETSRFLTMGIGNMALQVEFDYFAKQMKNDKELLSLPSLYSRFTNACEIQCYHGTNDNLISHTDKRRFCENISYCSYNEIDEKQVDGEIFKSTTHGLGADFLKLFEHAMSKTNFTYSNKIQLNNVMIKTTDNLYEINYETGVPVLTIKSSAKS